MIQNLLAKPLNIPYFLRIALPTVLLSFFASGMLIFRVVKAWEYERWFLFFGWNLFLAWIPLAIALWVQWRQAAQKLSKLSLFFALCVWLLFLPNSPYMITDLLHLKNRDNIIPMWYDTLFFFTLALAGLQACMLSLFLMQKTLNQYFSKKLVWIFVIGALLLTGFGVYLGRELRWNSWDIVAQPLELIYTIVYQLFNLKALQFTFAYFVALKVFYLMFIYQREMKQGG
jgi:uncharacterized membrane protein